MSRWIKRWISPTAVGALLLSAVPFAFAEEEGPVVVVPRLDANSDAGVEGRVEVRVSDYWIGLACSPEGITPALRAQLGIKEGEGLLVSSVVAESPAAKAGFKEHDILVSAGEKSLKDLASLIDAVDAAKETEMSVELLRDGRRITVKVTPAKRPDNQRPHTEDERRTLRNLPEHLRELLGRMHADPNNIFVRPGIVFERRMAMALPKDMSITVQKEGDSPAKITVRQGDKSYEATSDDLSKLPEEVRAIVNDFLGNGPMGLSVRVAPPGAVLPPHPGQVAPQPGQAIPALPAPGGPVQRFRMRREADDDLLQDILRRLDDLQKAVEQLKKDAPK